MGKVTAGLTGLGVALIDWGAEESKAVVAGISLKELLRYVLVGVGLFGDMIFPRIIPRDVANHIFSASLPLVIQSLRARFVKGYVPVESFRYVAMSSAGHTPAPAPTPTAVSRAVSF